MKLKYEQSGIQSDDREGITGVGIADAIGYSMAGQKLAAVFDIFSWVLIGLDKEDPM